MTVIITQEHCKDSKFSDIYGCPLYRAIKEQQSELEGFLSVGGSFIILRDKEGVGKFLPFNDTSWNFKQFCKLKSGEIQPITLTINN